MPALAAIALVGAAFLCRYGFVWLVFNKGVRVSEAVDTMVGVTDCETSALLPVVGFRPVRAKRSTTPFRKLPSMAFLDSLTPAVIVLRGSCRIARSPISMKEMDSSIPPPCADSAAGRVGELGCSAANHSPHDYQ